MKGTTMSAEKKLEQLALELPAASTPVGAYVSAMRTGDLIVTAGQIPLKDGQLVAAGKVPTDVRLGDA